MSLSSRTFGTGRVAFAAGVADRYATAPYVRGRVEERLGDLLVKDGFIGLSRRRPYAGGLVGCALTLIMGLVFIAAGGAVVRASNGGSGDRVTAGSVTSVPGKLSSKTCSIVASYAVDGTAYTTRSSISSSGMCRTSVGDAVQVRYHSARPSDAAVVTPDRGMTPLFPALGWLLVVIAVASVPMRVVAIAAGVRLRRQGRARAAVAPLVPIGTVLDEVTQAYWSAFGLQVATGTTWSRMGRQASVQPAVAIPAQVQPTPTPPPPGWYEAPDGSAAVEWWDGVRWSGVRNAASH